MSKQTIRVAAIRSTKNDEFKQLELRASIEKPATANQVGFFLQGAPNVSSQMEELVAWQTVSKAFIEKFGIKVGTTDFAAAIGEGAKIVVTESFSPMRQSYDTSGNLVPQSPKKIPNLSIDVFLTKDGQPIYRNTELKINPTEFEDTLIQHDKLPQEIRNMISEERANKVNTTAASKVVAEPTLD